MAAALAHSAAAALALIPAMTAFSEEASIALETSLDATLAALVAATAALAAALSAVLDERDASSMASEAGGAEAFWGYGIRLRE